MIRIMRFGLKLEIYAAALFVFWVTTDPKDDDANARGRKRLSKMLSGLKDKVAGSDEIALGANVWSMDGPDLRFEPLPPPHIRTDDPYKDLSRGR